MIRTSFTPALRKRMVRYRSGRYASLLLPKSELIRPSDDKTFKYGYENTPYFRTLADTRVKILRDMMPKEYQLRDFVLLECIYDEGKSVDRELKTRMKDARFDSAPVHMRKESIRNIGYELLKCEVHKYAYDSALSRNIDTEDPLDLFYEATQTAAVMSTIGTRKLFVNQFMKNSSAGTRDWNSFKDVPIKLANLYRESLIFSLCGHIHFELGTKKCSDFIREFIILGRKSTLHNYEHEGLSEIYLQKNSGHY